VWSFGGKTPMKQVFLQTVRILCNAGVILAGLMSFMLRTCDHIVLYDATSSSVPIFVQWACTLNKQQRKTYFSAPVYQDTFDL